MPASYRGRLRNSDNSDSRAIPSGGFARAENGGRIDQIVQEKETAVRAPWCCVRCGEPIGLPLLGDAFATVAARRVLSIGLYSSLLAILTIGSPLLLPALLLLDTARDFGGLIRGALPRFLLVRTLALAYMYLLLDLMGVVCAFYLWLTGGRWTGTARHEYVRRNFHLQSWFGKNLAKAGLGLFDVELSIEGSSALEHGPFLCFVRHSSVVDTMLAILLISSRHNHMLRYVLKRRLLWDPAFDIVGHRIPNRFARHGSASSADEVKAVASLAEELGPNDGVLIYPEGTRFTPDKRERAIASLKRQGFESDAARAEKLRHVLLPRRGGPTALLQRNAQTSRADVVFFAHTGFEGSATFRDLLGGHLLHRTVHIRFWRVPFAQVPIDPEAQRHWLYSEWEKIERFVLSRRDDSAD